jgi:hypothetical protein
MKRNRIAPFLLIVLVGLACNLPVTASKPTAKPTAAKTAAKPALTTTLALPTRPGGTATPAATQKASVAPTRPAATVTLSASSTPEKPAVTPTETASAPDFYTEEFDTAPLDNWKYVFVTGNEEDSTIDISNSRLKFVFPDRETYGYVYYQPYNYTDVYVEATIENFETNRNGVAVICRAGEKGWYEFRISTGGTYNVYRFDQKLKDQNQTPYIELASGATASIRAGKAKLNTFGLYCSGSQLRLYANGTEIRPQNKIIEDTNLSKGMVGIGVMSFVERPVHVEFEKVDIRPQP